jgi:hypothetical protein
LLNNSPELLWASSHTSSSETCSYPWERGERKIRGARTAPHCPTSAVIPVFEEDSKGSLSAEAASEPSRTPAFCRGSYLALECPQDTSHLWPLWNGACRVPPSLARAPTPPGLPGPPSDLLFTSSPSGSGLGVEGGRRFMEKQRAGTNGGEPDPFFWCPSFVCPPPSAICSTNSTAVFPLGSLLLTPAWTLGSWAEKEASTEICLPVSTNTRLH